MTLRTILIHPDPRLRKSCARIDTFDAKLRSLADDMLETMYDAPGVGLAAPQIGLTRQLLVMDCSDKEEPQTPCILINPEISWESEETHTYEEGCLSIPEQYGDVTRPERVRVRFHDIDGVEQEEEFDGLWSTCVQHEIDHLRGKLFIDYLSAMKRTMITNKMKKLKKERARA